MREITTGDEQGEQLEKASARAGKSISELVEVALDKEYGYGTEHRERLRRAFREAAGTADPEDFDGLSGEEYVQKIRRGWMARVEHLGSRRSLDIMHRTQIMLADEQYEELERESARTGRSIGDLVRNAVDDRYGAGRRERLLQAIRESAGSARPDDFDGLTGEEYVEKIRQPGMDERLRRLGWA